MSEPAPSTKDALTGWLWVAAQAAILAAVIVLPGNSHWPLPEWLRVITNLLFFGGLGLLGAAALKLGSALTPTPVPKDASSLTTDGLYRFMRHPIYTGVLITVTAMVLRSGSVWHLAIGATAVIFFDRKAAWEEIRLAERYPDYADYASRTARFVPRVW